jgi:hypothetical protein
MRYYLLSGGEERGQSALLVLAVFQVFLAQNNPYAK